jgi:hypothetical protein
MNSPLSPHHHHGGARRWASAGSWTPSVRPRVRERQTVNASRGAERTAPPIRHRPSDDLVAQMIGAVARSTRGDVLAKSTIAGGCVYHASRLRTVGRDLADAVQRTTDVVLSLTCEHHRRGMRCRRSRVDELVSWGISEFKSRSHQFSNSPTTLFHGFGSANAVSALPAGTSRY